MARASLIAVVISLTISGSAWAEKEPAAKPKRRRGFAVAEVARPAHFPHRIWAFCGFEAKLPSFGWFGKAETVNIPRYRGNAAARRGAGPYKRFAALMTGCNPVPGPRMGPRNYMYCRYYITGGDRATFQHYSLSRGDNNHVNVSGLTQGKWSELTLNFTCDARRNDGSKEAFRKGERMDDLKVFVGKPADGKEWEFVLDDVIFFSHEPGLPFDKEPFPNRVLFLAAFDTGIDARGKDKFYPGRWEVAQGAKAPAGSYWAVAGGVPGAHGKSSEVLLKMAPARMAGLAVKLRFRYWVKGADRLSVALQGAAPNVKWATKIRVPKQGAWTTRYVDFTELGGGNAELAPGDKLDGLRFRAVGDGPVRLYVDEVVLFEPGKPLKLKRGAPKLP